ncbi:MAG: winged helix-turn-helix transcriptional regulator [Bacteroidetes bacterium]|nr:winged helix-turn-helix transcriptional regulator [Bacteroidota bacterium]
MGATKEDGYTEEQLQLVRMAKAIGHPARLAILQELLKRDACVCGQLVLELPLSQPTVSQHLKELKQAGLIKGWVEGTSVCYCIDQKNWRTAARMFGHFFGEIKG